MGQHAQNAHLGAGTSHLPTCKAPGMGQRATESPSQPKTCALARLRPGAVPAAHEEGASPPAAMPQRDGECGAGPYLALPWFATALILASMVAGSPM